MPVTQEAYEKALDTIAKYGVVDRKTLDKGHLAALIAARLTVRQYKKENP